MKYLLGFLGAAFFSAALVSPALAAETLMYSESSQEYSTKKVLIITDTESVDSLLSSIFESYEPRPTSADKTSQVEPPVIDNNQHDNSSQTIIEPEPNDIDRELEDTGGTPVRSAAGLEPEQLPLEQVPYTGATSLRFSSLYPNTTGEDAKEEYIELVNTGDQTISLTGWSLTDAGGKTKTLELGSVAPNETKRLLRSETGISLNNEGDALVLKDPNGLEIDQTHYGKAPTGETYNFGNKGWVWSSSTQTAEPNQVPRAPMAAASTNNIATKSAPVNQINTLPDERNVTAHGTVSAAPAVLGKQIFYLQDGTGGIQVYKHDSDFPQLTEGTGVEVSGLLSTAQGQRRIKLSSKESILVQESSLPLSIQESSLENLSNQPNGILVKTNGRISTRSSTGMNIEKGESVAKISFSALANIDSSSLKNGALVEVTGILLIGENSVTIKPRSQLDIKVLEEPVPVASSATQSTERSTHSSDGNIGTSITLGASVILVALFVRHYKKELYALAKKATPVHKGAG